MVHEIRASIRSLSKHPEFGTLDAVFLELSSLSGLSKSAVMKLHSGEAINPTADTIDKLMAALDAVSRKCS